MKRALLMSAIAVVALHAADSLHFYWRNAPLSDGFYDEDERDKRYYDVDTQPEEDKDEVEDPQCVIEAFCTREHLIKEVEKQIAELELGKGENDSSTGIAVLPWIPEAREPLRGECVVKIMGRDYWMRMPEPKQNS